LNIYGCYKFKYGLARRFAMEWPRAFGVVIFAPLTRPGVQPRIWPRDVRVCRDAAFDRLCARSSVG
jgi:hypothetical protein